MKTEIQKLAVTAHNLKTCSNSLKGTTEPFLIHHTLLSVGDEWNWGKPDKRVLLHATNMRQRT